MGAGLGSGTWLAVEAVGGPGAAPVDPPGRLDRQDGPRVALAPGPGVLLGEPAWHVAASAEERRRFDEAHGQLDNPPRGMDRTQVLQGVIGRIEDAVACPARGPVRGVETCRERFRKERSRLELGRNYLGTVAPTYYQRAQLLGADTEQWQLGRSDERQRYDEAHGLIDRGQPLERVRSIACRRNDDDCWHRFTGERQRLELVREARRSPGAFARFDALGHQAAPARTDRVRTLAPAPADQEQPSGSVAETVWGAPARLLSLFKRPEAPTLRRIELVDVTPDDGQVTVVVEPDEVTLEEVKALIASSNANDEARYAELVARLDGGPGLWERLVGWVADLFDGDDEPPTASAPAQLPAGAGPDEDAGADVEAARGSGGGLFSFLGRTQDRVVGVLKWAVLAGAVLGVGWLIAATLIAPYVVPAIAGILNTGISTAGGIAGKSLDAGGALVKSGLGFKAMGA